MRSKAERPTNCSWCLWSIPLHERFSNWPCSLRCDVSVCYFFYPPSSAFLRVNRLIDFVTQLTDDLHVGSLVSCHNFLSLFFGFNSRSKPGRSVLTSESVTILVDSLYAETMEAVKSWAILSASISVLISSLGGINSEAMF
jgi:hypothetical protein